MLESKIKEIIIERYGSVRQFAIKIDIPYATVDSILKRGIDNSNVSNVMKICKVLEISIDKTLEKKDVVSIYSLNNDEVNTKIAVLGKIPAGMPFEAIEDAYAIDTVDIPKKWLRGGNTYFALRLDGDSMEPEYLDKDVVIFKKTNDCENGDDCAIRIGNSDVTFKRIRKQENGILVIPLNENNSTGFMPTFFTKKEIIDKPVEVIGVVKQIRRNK